MNRDNRLQTRKDKQRTIDNAFRCLIKETKKATGLTPSIAKRTRSKKRHLLTTKDAAKLLGRRPHTLENWRCNGDGPPFHKTGGSIVYKRSDLNEYLEERKFNHTSAYHSFSQKVEAK